MHRAKLICEKYGIDPERAYQLTEDEVGQLATFIDSNFIVEGNLRREVQSNIARFREDGCYVAIVTHAALPWSAFKN